MEDGTWNKAICFVYITWTMVQLVYSSRGSTGRQGDPCLRRGERGREGTMLARQGGEERDSDGKYIKFRVIDGKRGARSGNKGSAGGIVCRKS
jgi:hypothetical protein